MTAAARQLEDTGIDGAAAAPSHFPDPLRQAVPLLDALTIHHGPARLIAEFFARAEALMLSHGIRLWFSNDFRVLEQINAANIGSWYRLWPAFTAEGGAGEGNAYFFIGTLDGRVVATQVGRVYDMPEGLTEGCRSLRFMYSDPASMATPEDRCALLGDAALHGEEIRGTIVQSGGTWFHGELARGRGFAHVFPRLSRAFALARWGTDWTVSTVRQSLADIGVGKAYGYKRLYPELIWKAPPSRAGYTKNDPLNLVSLSRAETIADLEEAVASQRFAVRPRPQAAE
ncbi:MAG: hypothetical protein FJX54_24400 [Alphaproteobacteria bacterium]|nr:hypothetical protein [Alphaproteobacteria bacterium]